jgi:hypothetical protein
MRRFHLEVDTVQWFGSNNGGTNYYPFLNAVNGEFTALNFPKSSNELRVKGYVTNGQGWIQGYKLKPIYGYKDGEYAASGLPTDANTEVTVAIDTIGDNSVTSQIARISGTATGFSGVNVDVSTTGQLDSSNSRDVRLFAEGAGVTSYDVRSTGQADSLSASDVRIFGVLAALEEFDTRLIGEADSSEAFDAMIEGV